MLLWAVLAVWGVCFALHVNQLRVGGLQWVPIRIAGAHGPGGHPAVLGGWGGETQGTLRPGDELLAVSGTPLRGATRADFITRAYAALATAPVGEAQIRVRRGQEVFTGALPTLPIPWPWRGTALSLAFAAIGAAVFVRSRGQRVARLMFLGSAGYAVHWAYWFGGSAGQTYMAMLAFGGGLAAAMVFTLRTLFVFPEETASRGRVAWTVPASFAVSGPAVSSWAFGVPFPASVGLPVNLVATIGLFAVGGGLLARNFRRSPAGGRRRIKWLLFGFYVGLAPLGIASLLVLARPALWWVFEAATLAVVAIPVSIGIAVSFHNLFDIDRLITRAATLTMIAGVLLAASLFAIPRVAARLEFLLDPAVAQAGLSVAVAALLFAGRSSVEPRLADWLFTERRQLQSGVERVLAEIASCEKPAELLTLLGDRLRDLLDPLCTAVYARAGDVYAPVFASGPAIAPAFSTSGALVTALGVRGEPVPGRRLRRSATTPLHDEEREALDAMGAELVVPVAPDGRLEALICLGEKRSGDVFSETDRALLARVADRAAVQIARYDREQVERAERELVAQLERFVPGAVREQLESGEQIEPGPREVSVLFADLVAYTRFAERRSPGEIFDVVSRYTEVASAVVGAHGGSVVDFRGDGLMAVFGAPVPLETKERAAIRAARDIVSAVAELDVSERADANAPAAVEVGVGVATGEAFVGTIRSVERQIWTVLGNTTNLAARLEAMTRELDAAVVIDHVTAARAGDAAEDFAALGPTAVRGRSVPLDLYALERAAVVGARPATGEPNP